MPYNTRNTAINGNSWRFNPDFYACTHFLFSLCLGSSEIRFFCTCVCCRKKRKKICNRQRRRKGITRRFFWHLVRIWQVCMHTGYGDVSNVELTDLLGLLLLECFCVVLHTRIFSKSTKSSLMQLAFSIQPWFCFVLSWEMLFFCCSTMIFKRIEYEKTEKYT